MLENEVTLRASWIVVGAVALSAGSASLGYRYGKGRAVPSGRLPLAADAGREVATFDDQRLGTADLLAWMDAEGPGARARLSSAQVRKQYVDSWARMALLAHRAELSGLADSPEARRERVRRLASLYVEKNFEEPEKLKPVTDDEARAYFAAHRSEYAHPETFELAQVLYQAKDAADRVKARARAQRALRELQRNPSSQPYAFETLARQSSDDLVSASNGGRLAPMTREDLTRVWGAKSAAMLAGLPPNSSPVLVEDATGVHLVRLLRHELAVSPSFETVSDPIKSRIRSTRKDADYQAFLSKLESDAHLRIDDAVVGNLFTNNAKER